MAVAFKRKRKIILKKDQTLEIVLPNGVALIVWRNRGDTFSVHSDKPSVPIKKGEYPEGRLGQPGNTAFWDDRGMLVDSFGGRGPLE